MTGVSAFLFFFSQSHNHHNQGRTLIMSQSFTSMDARTQQLIIDKDTHTVTIDTMTGMYHSKPKDDKDVPRYPEPEGDPSY